MRIVPPVAVIVLALFSSDVPHVRAGQGTTAQRSATAQTMTTYCSGCHNGAMRSPSGALLDQFDPARIPDNPDVWVRAYRQIQAGTMPPVGAPRPARATADALLAA